MRSIKNVQRSRGAALLVALIILLAITLLGVASLKSGIFHEKMSLNSQADTLTFMGAESSINSVISSAAQAYDNPNSPASAALNSSFFTKVVLFGKQVSCTTVSGPVARSCGEEDKFDVRSGGVLQAQAETIYDGSSAVFNSDPDTLAYHKFLTQGTGYFKPSLKLPFAHRNQQEWKKLGVASAFSMKHQDLVSAAEAN